MPRTKVRENKRKVASKRSLAPRNRKLYFALGLGFSVCLGYALQFATSQSFGHKARRGTIAQWEHRLYGDTWAETQDSAPKRGVADAQQPRCLKDRLTLENLRADIARLEKERGGQPVQGKWAGVDKSSLSPAQGEFLSYDDGKWIHSKGISFAGCSDVPCILNQVYGTPGAEAGYKAYWWYLRMGSIFSMTDKLPADKGGSAFGEYQEPYSIPNLTYRDYLLSESELSAFWILSWTLSDSYRYLPSFKQVYRIPRTYRARSWFRSAACKNAHPGMDYIVEDPAPAPGQTPNPDRCETMTVAGAVGDPKYGWGQIRMSDFALQITNPIVPSRNSFFLTAPHEVTHLLDLVLAKTQERFALDPEWIEISGWECVKVITVNGFSRLDCTHPDFSNGQPRGWLTNSIRDEAPPRSESFVSDYAVTSPAEDFAETAAYFRFRPERALFRSPQKSALISQKIYGGRTFDSAGLTRYYTSAATTRVAAALGELVKQCSAGDPVLPDKQASGKLSFDGSIPARIVRCLEIGLDDRISAELDQLRATEWEACDHLPKSESEIRAKVFAELNPRLVELVKQQAEIGEMLAAARELKDALSLEVDPREAYLHCHRQPDPQGCYEKALADAYDGLANDPSQGKRYGQRMGDLLEQNRALYLAENDYDTSRLKVHEFYQMIYAGSDRMLQNVAETRWKECAAATGDGPALLFEPFSGGTQFIAAPILQCLNQAAYSDVDQVRDRYAKRLGVSVTDPDAAALTRDLLLPKYLEALRELLTAGVKREGELHAQRKPTEIDAIASRVASERTWVAGTPGALSPQSLKDKCQPRAEAAFNERVGAVAGEQSLPMRFHAFEDVRLEWAKDACERAVNDFRVKLAVKEEIDKAWTPAASALEGAIVSQADGLINDCWSKYPGNWAQRKYQRENCYNHNWKTILGYAIKDWSQSDAGKPFAEDAERRAQFLKTNESRLRLEGMQRLKARTQ